MILLKNLKTNALIFIMWKRDTNIVQFIKSLELLSPKILLVCETTYQFVIYQNSHSFQMLNFDFKCIKKIIYFFQLRKERSSSDWESYEVI